MGEDDDRVGRVEMTRVWWSGTKSGTEASGCSRRRGGLVAGRGGAGEVGLPVVGDAGCGDESEEKGW